MLDRAIQNGLKLLLHNRTPTDACLHLPVFYFECRPQVYSNPLHTRTPPILNMTEIRVLSRVLLPSAAPSLWFYLRAIRFILPCPLRLAFFFTSPWARLLGIASVKAKGGLHRKCLEAVSSIFLPYWSNTRQPSWENFYRSVQGNSHRCSIAVLFSRLEDEKPRLPASAGLTTSHNHHCRIKQTTATHTLSGKPYEGALRPVNVSATDHLQSSSTGWPLSSAV